MENQDFRKVQKFVDGEWRNINFEDLKKGDKFRMFETTGEPVVDDYNVSEFVAESDPFVNKYGITAVEIKNNQCNLDCPCNICNELVCSEYCSKCTLDCPYESTT
ncbi:hypothetical protein [Thermosipho sp. (in: thermotogales)]|jgi:hypothetical protein|uniref:hypothetical protein n=1 Tax=Thermosipho sp. (in: thermotogales) TaxID=1968895 RepID=UPI0025806EFA|nr:hypothetical protein [Thermosipho sp. (in: thermotogales)]MBZ4649251.1 hypothetical protein [Thermosipho sp. (in: thermotogales)]